MEEVTKMKKSEIIAELQKLGIEVNPGKKQADLLEILMKAQNGEAPSAGPEVSPIPRVMTSSPAHPIAEKQMSDTERIMNAISGVASSVDNLNKRVNRLETGGKDDFKLDVKTEDVQEASRGKESLDPRIVKIVEDTLGIDFGIEVKGNNDRPGFELTILVPQRLSNIQETFRPVRDEVTGQYKVDEKTKQVIEEKYWPGDRRTIQLGSTASYELIQERCNRIRSFILSWYQKSNKPTPEFKIK